MFHLAGVVCRNLGVNAEVNQPIRQQGVAFIDAFRDFFTFVCQQEIAVMATLTLGFEKFSSVATSMERTTERRLLRINIVSR